MKKISEEEFRKKLTLEQYRVLREGKTEAPFSGKYVSKRDKGTYNCAACGAKLFNSDSKFEAKEPGLVGWPSFNKLEDLRSVILRPDSSLGASRIEVICSNCSSHLGHLFKADDSGTGEHYCINSCALEFKG